MDVDMLKLEETPKGRSKEDEVVMEKKGNLVKK